MTAVTPSEITIEALRAEELSVVALRQRAEVLKAQYEEAEREASSAAQALEWKRILRRIEDDALLKQSFVSLRGAITAYHQSFKEPEGYHNSGDGEDVVDYTATDDYGDFTGVDRVVDEILDKMHEQLEAGHSDRAALMLLICSSEIGRELQSAVEQSKSTSGNAVAIPVGEIEDCRDGIVAEWQQLFFDAGEDVPSVALGSGRLSEVDAQRWFEVVASHLGAPFDSRP